jgi:hypothetical protein
MDPKRSHAHIIRTPHKIRGLCASARNDTFFLACADNVLYRVGLNFGGSRAVSRFAGVAGDYALVDGPRLGKATFDFRTSNYKKFPRVGLVESKNGTLWISMPSCIRQIIDNEVTTVAGNATEGYRDGGASAAQFHFPSSLAYSESSSTLFICDTGNHCIRSLHDGIVSTLIGATNGQITQLRGYFIPSQISLSLDERQLYVTGRTAFLVMKLPLGTVDELFDLDTSACSHLILPDKSILAAYKEKKELVRLMPSRLSSLCSNERTSFDHPDMIFNCTPELYDCNMRGVEIAIQCDSDGLVLVPSHPFWSAIFCPLDLSPLLDSHAFSDLPIIVNPESSTEFHLHSFVLDSWGLKFERLKDLLEKSTFGKDDLELFVHLLYSDWDKDETHDIITIFRCTFMFLQLGIRGLLPFFRKGLEYLRNLSGEQICALLLDIWTFCDQNAILTDIVMPYVGPHADIFFSKASEWTSVFNFNPTALFSLVGRISKESIKPTLPCITWALFPPAVKARQLCHDLDWIEPFGEQITPGCFRISISRRTSVLEVRMEILYSGWSYFRRMVIVGGQEVTNRHIELPSDFPPQLLFALIRSLHETVYVWSLEKSECFYLLLRGPEYEIDHLDPPKIFATLIHYCRQQILPPLSLSNCIQNIVYLSQLNMPLELTEAIEYSIRNVSQVAATHPKLGDLLDQLSDETCKRILKRLFYIK